MSSLYKMSGTYRVHMTASHWLESYNELKDRTESPARPVRGKTAVIRRRREGHAPAAKPTRH